MEENNTNKSVMHIVSLVLGIISIVTALFWYICDADRCMVAE